MPIIYVPRVFGGTLILNVTPPVPPPSNAVLRVRSGTALARVRSGTAIAKVRSGEAVLRVREP